MLWVTCDSLFLSGISAELFGRMRVNNTSEASLQFWMFLFPATCFNFISNGPAAHLINQQERSPPVYEIHRCLKFAQCAPVVTLMCPPPPLITAALKWSWYYPEPVQFQTQTWTWCRALVLSVDFTIPATLGFNVEVRSPVFGAFADP